MDTKTILIIDDEEQLANLMSMKASKSGFKGFISNSVSDASLKLQNQKFDGVILDMRLGARSGEQVIGLIRDAVNSINKTTPIIVVSAFLEPDLIKKIATKVQGIFTKPVDVPQLLLKLQELCFKK